MHARKAFLLAVSIGALTLTGVPAPVSADETGQKPGTQDARETAADSPDAAKLAESRHDIDIVSQEAIEELITENDNAATLYEQAAGYAVFRAAKAGLVVTGAGGVGVAVNKATKERTYMNMGSGGLGLGAGIQSYRLILLFESDDDLARFIDGAWDAAASAQAAAGTSGANAASSFVDGIATYQLTDKGLMAQADLTGTRFWSSDKLNDR